MPEDDLSAIGALRQQLREAELALARLDRRVAEFDNVLRDYGRRLTFLETQRPVVRPPQRGTGAAGDPELAPPRASEPSKDGG